MDNSQFLDFPPPKAANPAGVTGDFHVDCRECMAGYSQAIRSMTGFKCTEHGVMAYDSKQAINAAIQHESQAWAHSEKLDGDIIEHLKNALAECKKIFEKDYYYGHPTARKGIEIIEKVLR